MKDKELTNKADKLYQKANRLLSEYPFQDIAKKHFKQVKIVGAAATNLMLDPDIDFDCLVDQVGKRKVLKFVGDLLDIKGCKKVILYNHFMDKPPHFIVNVEKFDFAKEKWILTFFIIEDKGRKAGHAADWVKSNLTEESRKAIFRLKEFRADQGLKRTITSSLIYEAVLSENIRTIATFKDYLLKQGIDPTKRGTH